MTRHYSRWDHSDNVLIGQQAALNAYQGGLSELLSFRMAVHKLSKEKQKPIPTVAMLPKTAREIFKTEFQRLCREGKRILGDPLPNNEGPQLDEQLAIMRHEIAALTSKYVQLHDFARTRITQLEDMLLDAIGDAAFDAYKARAKDAQKQADEPAILPRIAILGILPSQARIFERDFPAVKFSFLYDGKTKLDPQVCVSNDLVILTKWAPESLWEIIKHNPNAKYVKSGMTVIKDMIQAQIKAM